MKNMQKYIAEPENMQFSVSPDFFGGGAKMQVFRVFTKEKAPVQLYEMLFGTLGLSHKVGDGKMTASGNTIFSLQML